MTLTTAQGVALPLMEEEEEEGDSVVSAPKIRRPQKTCIDASIVKQPRTMPKTRRQTMKFLLTPILALSLSVCFVIAGGHEGKDHYCGIVGLFAFDDSRPTFVGFCFGGVWLEWQLIVKAQQQSDPHCYYRYIHREIVQSRGERQTISVRRNGRDLPTVYILNNPSQRVSGKK